MRVMVTKEFIRTAMPVVTFRRCRSFLPAMALITTLLISLAMTKFVQAQSSNELILAAAAGGTKASGQAEPATTDSGQTAPLGKGAYIQGAPADLSADEAARQLANPNTPLASLTFKNQYRWYKGKLPGAEGQDNYTLLFQPVFPFPVSDTDTIFFRPAFPLLVEQPVFQSNGKFGAKTGLGDIGFDLAYGRNEKSGLLWAGGIVSTVPTATANQLAGKHLTLGPELFIGLFKSWGVVGLFPNHQWDIAGWGKGHVNASQIQAFAVFLPGDGWSVGSAPIMNYNWASGEWTIPIQMQVSKTIIIGSMPWKFQFEVNHYVQRPDAFGPKWMIGFNITPVVKNVVAEWFK